MEDRETKVFELAVCCDSTGLYLDYSSPKKHRDIAAKILSQYGIDNNKYLTLHDFYDTMDKALTKLMSK